jgi:hypothetical protein
MAKAVLGIALWLALAVPLSTLSADKTRPAWTQLTAEQQRILAPIQAEWETLDAQRKQKWLGITQRYPKMGPDEQARLQRRMKEWATLTPAQRQAARDKYREFEQLTPTERQAMREKWEQYQQEVAAREAAARAAEAEAQAKGAASEDGTTTADAGAGAESERGVKTAEGAAAEVPPPAEAAGARQQ